MLVENTSKNKQELQYFLLAGLTLKPKYTDVLYGVVGGTYLDLFALNVSTDFGFTNFVCLPKDLSALSSLALEP